MKLKEKNNIRPLYDDLLFKECFAKEENRIYLEYFLETMLNLKKGYLHHKLMVFYESPIAKQNYSDKAFRGDLLIYFDDYVINIECFSKFDKESLEKTMCYAMRLASNTKRSHNYKSMKKVIQIVLVKNMQVSFSKETMNKYLITNVNNVLDYLNKEEFQIYYYRMDDKSLDNARASNYNECIKLRWLNFIGADKEILKEIAMKEDRLLMEFNQNIEEYALDEYSKELFREWDREIFRHQAERAEKEALKRIKIAENNAKIAENNAKVAENNAKIAEKKVKVAEKNSMIKIAKNLIIKGMNLEFIAETTGLKKDEINHLIDQQNIVKG